VCARWTRGNPAHATTRNAIRIRISVTRAQSLAQHPQRACHTWRPVSLALTTNSAGMAAARARYGAPSRIPASRPSACTAGGRPQQLAAPGERRHPTLRVLSLKPKLSSGSPCPSSCIVPPYTTRPDEPGTSLAVGPSESGTAYLRFSAASDGSQAALPGKFAVPLSRARPEPPQPRLDPSPPWRLPLTPGG
jgi:hypothetical protein